jgi:hypothetical protein
MKRLPYVTLHTEAPVTTQTPCPNSGVDSRAGCLRMTSQTITTLVTNTVFLNGGDDLTVTSSGTIAPLVSNSSYVAIFVTGAIGTLTNAGEIIGANNGIVSFGAINELVNSGTISGLNIFGIDTASIGTVTNSGLIDGSTNGLIDYGDANEIDNSPGGTISASFSTAIYVGGTIGTLTNAGVISGPTAINEGGSGGTLILDPTSVIDGNVEFNDGTLELAGSTEDDIAGIGTQYTGFTTIAFDGVDDLAVGNVSGLASGESITGFADGDVIGIVGFGAVSGTYVTGEGLVLTDANSNTETLDIVGAYTTANFEIFTNGLSTLVMELCYLRGTRILTPAGEVPVESLQIGDLVVTRQGGFRPVKWIGRQSYDARFVANDAARLPVRIRPGALGEGLPARDLYVSPGHSMLVDGKLLLASTLVNGVTITHECPDDMALIEYFQPELEGHDCILAEGAWSETFADGPGLRDAYHNAAEFWALYPDYRTPDAIHLCAPRPERGTALDTALRPLVARASRGVTQGHLLGSIDRVSGREIDGWAFDAANPHLPVLVEVVVGGEVVHTALACDFRPDLREAGFGLGRCAFFLMLAEEIPAELLHTLHIRRAGDGATLPMSEICRTSYLRAA